MDDPLSRLGLRFAELTLNTETPAGRVYRAKDFSGVPVAVAIPADRPDARDAFVALVQRHRAGTDPDPVPVHSADLTAARPWAAVRVEPGRPGAERLLPETPAAETPAAEPAPEPETPAAEPAPEPPAAPDITATSIAARPAPTPPVAGTRPAAAGSAGVRSRARSVLVAVVLVAGLGVATTAVRAVQSDTGTLAAATPAPVPVATPGEAIAPPANPTPAPAATPTDSGQLRDVPALSVLGPTWTEQDVTTALTLPGWPFGFRVPPGWQCRAGSYQAFPEASAWQCTSTLDPTGGHRVNVMLWECESTCTAAEQDSMREQWLDEPERAVPADHPLTWYVETEEPERYTVDLTHFAGDPDGTLRWHVGVFLQAPPDDTGDVLRVLNDVVTQASG